MNGDAGIPILVPAGLPGALPEGVSGEAFWALLQKSLPTGGLAGSLDDLLMDRPAPRVWLLMHRPGKEQASAICAAALAAACAARQQATVLLDVDEEEALLSRKTGRLDQDGWLDMARYGASLNAAAVVVSWPGRMGRFLGLGSYRPTEVTDQERRSLLGRLRHQADDIILVSGAGPSASLWAQHADLRLFCWDRTSDGPEVKGLAAGVMERAGRPLTGILALGQAPAEPGPQAQPAPVAAAAAVSEPATPEISRPPTAGADQTPHARRRPRRGSSWVFRLAALVVLALISVLGVYYWRYLRPDSLTQNVGPAAPATSLAEFARQAQQPEAGPPDGGRPATGWVVADTQGTTGADTTLIPVAAGADSAVTPVAAGLDTVAVKTALQPEDSAAAPAEAAPESSAADQVGATEPPALDREAFTGPVGAAGWALHVYSLPDSSGAADQAAGVRSHGIAAAIVPHEAADGRLWYRVLMGSFATRREAAAAAPALLAELRADYAGPVKFTESAPE